MDDTAAISVSADPDDLSLQHAADGLCMWSSVNGMVVNENKTKEMMVYFGRNYYVNCISAVCINGKHIERVQTFKLLGVHISNDLSWDVHVEYMLKKVAKRMYCINCLIRIGADASDIISVYCSIIRSILDYACPVWHPGLTKCQHKTIERVQKRFIKILYPSLSYSEGLTLSGLERLYDRRERLTKEMFNEIKNHNHVLHDILPVRSQMTSSYNLRNKYEYKIPIAKKTRYGRDFVPYCINRRY